MKEVASESEWVGKKLTCPQCFRTFEIEAGDEVLPGFSSGSSKHYIKKQRRFKLGCGHEFPLEAYKLSKREQQNAEWELKPDKDIKVPEYQMLTEGYNPNDLIR